MQRKSNDDFCMKKSLRIITDLESLSFHVTHLNKDSTVLKGRIVRINWQHFILLTFLDLLLLLMVASKCQKYTMFIVFQRPETKIAYKNKKIGIFNIVSRYFVNEPIGK